MRLTSIVPPGAGESTHAKVVARAGVAREMKVYFERGGRVPDETILPLGSLRPWRAGGWALGKFPASVARARALDGERGASKGVG